MESKILNALKWIGLGFLEPLIKLIQGKEKDKNIRLVMRQILVPALSVLIFLGACNLGSSYLYNKERDIKTCEV